jgi:hypothetical protein
MRIRRERDDSLTVRLPLGEALILKELPARLETLLDDPDFTDRTVARLFPPAYADEKKEAEYRRLVGADIRQRKLDCVRAFEGSLRRCKAKLTGVEIRVRPEEFELWLGFVNDMRILLGTELDITEDGWEKDFHPDHPRANDLALLHYLSWLEEELLRAGAKAGEPPTRRRR